MLSGYAREIAALGAQDVGRAIAHTGHLAVIFLLVLSAGLMVVAGVDVPLQIIQLMQKLRMTRKEVKDELKQTEGMPDVTIGLRRKQRAATRNTVRAEVKQAHIIRTGVGSWTERVFTEC